MSGRDPLSAEASGSPSPDEGRGRTPPHHHPLRHPRSWSRSSPPGPWDVVVVGSGMGGLAAAALLAQLGRRVLVLEQHYLPGGFTHAFARKGYVWDVGVHAIGEVTRHSRTGRLLERLTGGRLRWASLGSVYEEFHFPGGFRIDFPDHPEAFRETLLAAFPGEGKAIDGFLRRVRSAVHALRLRYLGRTLPPSIAPFLDPLLDLGARSSLRRTVYEVLDELTEDPRLKAVLTAQWGYYGLPPTEAPFAIQALITRHFLHGGYYPVGNAQEISRELTREIAAADGWTRVLAPVEEILVAGGRAVGVRMEGGEEIRAGRVIVASGIGTAVRRLLPQAYREARWAQEVRALEPGPAHVAAYLGFRGDIRAAGATSANQWFYRSWDSEASLWEVDRGEELPPAPVLYSSYPSLKDPEHAAGPERRHTGEIVTFVPWASFERWRETRWGRREEGYEELKARMQERLLTQLFAERPALEPLLDHVELSTPLSTDHFCRPLDGSIYGLAPTRERFACRWLRARSPIRGLYFAGSDVTTGGVMGAFAGGVLAALAVAPWDTLRHLRTL